jgi:hypothetical protein
MPFVGIGVGVGRQRFAQGGGIFAAYAARVAADGGVTEAGACVNAVSGISLNSSLLLVPSGYKSGVVYSEIPTDGDGDLTFTRASSATRVNSDGEAGSYATSYIPTTSATVTRLADSFTRNNIYTNGLITSSGGTWFVELKNNIAYQRDAGSTSLAVSTTSSDFFAGSTGFEILNNGSINRLSIIKRISGTATSLFLTTTDTVKIALKWNGTSADVFVNGTKVVSATSFTTTNMEFLKSFGADVPKYIQNMQLYPTPLSDSDCISLTTL